MDFEVNTDLSTYSDDEIAALIEQGNALLDELFAIDKPTKEQFAQASDVNEKVTSLAAEAASRQAAADEQATEWATLRDSRVTASNDDAEEEDAEEEAEVEDEAEESVEAAAAPVAPAPAPAKVTARAALAGKRPAVKPKPAKAPMTITASADVPGFATSSKIAGIPELAEAVVNRLDGFPRQPEGRRGAMWQPYGVAQFRKTFPDDLVVDGGIHDMDALSRAVDQSRLPGQSLVAAGGWCAPSETIYDFCENATADGLLSLPEVRADRGGVKFTTGPDFATLYSSTGFTQTEAQAISGTAKGCYEVTCPSFTDVRLDAIGLCIKVPILTNAAYPELVQSTIRQSLLAHQHRVSAYSITKMMAAATSVTLNAAGAATATILNSLEYLAHGIRSDYRLALDATIEVVLPTFARAIIRADLANRGGVDLLSVSDSQIDSYLATRNISAQYIYNWQDVTSSQEGWPATMDVLAYPAGTFVKATTDVINLSAVYDAASLNVNTFTGLFMEEGIAVFKRCFGAKKATITLCMDGSTGAADLATCFTLTP